MTKPKLANALNEDDLQWKMTSKYKMWNISLTTDQIIPKLANASNEDDLQWKTIQYLSNH